MEAVDAIVVGAGVIGLAVARAIASAGRSVVVVERHSHAGTETSSRNSGVIHSGIYYPPGSSKARLCVRGRSLFYQYCRERNVPHLQCGKLIVATSSEVSKLEALHANALCNGVDSLQWLDRAGIRAMEPVLCSEVGLWCPDTGIVSVHEFFTALHADVELAGGHVVFRTRFLGSQPTAAGHEVRLDCDGEPMSMRCSWLVNSAGLAAIEMLRLIGGYPGQRIPPQYFAKGNYFDFSGRSPFRHLVYPMPGAAGLGVHGTLDMAGRLRFGPDVEWVEGVPEKLDYAVDPDRVGQFIAAIREYWPEIPAGSLHPSYSGMRPKLVGPGAAAADFRIEGPVEHDVPGLINLLGMESPGLTSSLAIAEEVERVLA